LKNIEYDQVLKIHQKNIFIAGLTFEVAKRDGYSTNGYLKKYSENLQLLWWLKLDFTNKSEINHIEFYKDRIYALVTQGKNTNSTSETSLYLYAISSAGKVIDKLKMGDRSFSWPDNVVIVNDKMYFSYSQDCRASL
jgi:hypothetical protein